MGNFPRAEVTFIEAGRKISIDFNGYWIGPSGGNIMIPVNANRQPSGRDEVWASTLFRWAAKFSVSQHLSAILTAFKSIRSGRAPAQGDVSL